MGLQPTQRPDAAPAAGGDAYIVQGVDGSGNTQWLLVDTTGALISSSSTPTTVQGPAADGAAVSGNPVLVAGYDGTNVQTLLTDTAGVPFVSGKGAAAAAVVGNPVRVGGSDGTNLRDLLTDTAGRQRVVGAVDNGSTVLGRPVEIGGYDNGGLVRTLFMDTGGRPVLISGATTGLTGGAGTSDATTLRVALASNANAVTGAAASGAAKSGNPVLIAGQDGTNAVTLLTDSSGNLKVLQGAAAAANVLDGVQFFSATTGATTLITIPQGRTWVGEVGLAVTGSKAAASTGNGAVGGTLKTAGTSVTPAAGAVFYIGTDVGANAATGTVGTQSASSNGIRRLTVIAPAGNSVTITAECTISNVTTGEVYAWASGELQ